MSSQTPAQVPEPIPDAPIPPGVEITQSAVRNRLRIVPPVLVPVNYDLRATVNIEPPRIRSLVNVGVGRGGERIRSGIIVQKSIATKRNVPATRRATTKIRSHRIKSSPSSIKKSLKLLKISPAKPKTNSRAASPAVSESDFQMPLLLPFNAPPSQYSPEQFYPQDPSPPVLETADGKILTEL